MPRHPRLFLPYAIYHVYCRVARGELSLSKSSLPAPMNAERDLLRQCVGQRSAVLTLGAGWPMLGGSRHAATRKGPSVVRRVPHPRFFPHP